MNARSENGRHPGADRKGLRIGLRLGALASAVLLLGCGNPPEAELASARSAIEAARQAGAEKAASSTLWEATHSLDSALQEIDAQKKELLGRDYANARRLLQRAGDKAREAGAAALRASIEQELQAKAAAAKDTARTDSLPPTPASGPSASATAKDDAQSAINLTYAAYQQARRQAGPDAKAALDGVMQGLKDARAALKAKDYAKALALAGAAKAKLDSLPQ